MNNMSRRAMQERGLDILVRSPKGFQFTDTFFPYTSGEIGPYFVQAGGVQCNAKDFATATKDMKHLIQISSDFGSLDVIAGGETRDWIFSFIAARDLGLDHTMLYKSGKTVGADMGGKGVALVCDLNNEGSSPRDYWVPIIEANNGSCNDIFFYVDRMERGTGVIRDLGLFVNEAVVPLDAHAWNYLQQKKVITSEIYKNLRERRENQDDWAIDMLLSDKGVARYAELLGDQETHDKTVNVAKKYEEKSPGFKKELTERLAHYNTKI